uniref:40S ribosomal protein S26 n=1 Tax=Macrostomum lignano TaxID=282301 RepID=A0A1I8IUX3_9PLAT
AAGTQAAAVSLSTAEGWTLWFSCRRKPAGADDRIKPGRHDKAVSMTVPRRTGAPGPCWGRRAILSFPRLDELEEGITAAGTQEAARSNGQASGGGKRRRKTSDVPVVHPETVKTACYVKNVFMKIAERKRQSDFKYEYHHHTCCCYYTCAVNTDNVKKVLEGCRTFIIDKHLERFGIL